MRLDCTYLTTKLEVLKIEFDKYQAQYKANYYEDLFRDRSDSKRIWRNINLLLVGFLNRCNFILGSMDSVRVGGHTSLCLS